MQVNEKAYAKINLFLDVTERRQDGFHNIVSVMQSVSLCDTILLNASCSDTTLIRITSDEPGLPLDENNLIYKSAEKYLSYYGICAEVDIHLTKQIPIGAGLGGGSSDAAATLRALDKVFNLSSGNDLLRLSAEIGSDVPFCLIGGRALCTGRGEHLEAIREYPINHFVISIGKEKVLTPKAYRALDEKYGNFDGSAYTPVQYNGQLYNIFESVTDINEVDIIKEIMTKNGAESTLMSGSGPSVFGTFRNSDDAKKAAEILRSSGFSAFECHSVRENL